MSKVIEKIKDFIEDPKKPKTNFTVAGVKYSIEKEVPAKLTQSLRTKGMTEKGTQNKPKKGGQNKTK